MSLLLPRTGIIAAAAAAETTFELVASTAADQDTATDPWDGSVADPGGDGRIILDFINPDGTTGASATLDPAGTNDALTQAVAAVDAAGDRTRCEVWRLLEADMPSAFGTKTLRADLNAAALGFRQIITLHGADQTLFTDTGTGGFSGAETVSVTRPSGEFAAGTLVFAWEVIDTSNFPTVTGDAAVVRQETIPDTSGLSLTYAEGVLAAAQATVSVTFEPAFSSSERTRALVVVEPAP